MKSVKSLAQELKVIQQVATKHSMLLILYKLIFQMLILILTTQKTLKCTKNGVYTILSYC